MPLVSTDRVAFEGAAFPLERLRFIVMTVIFPYLCGSCVRVWVMDALFQTKLRGAREPSQLQFMV
jgi:hypothetical protein